MLRLKGCSLSIGLALFSCMLATAAPPLTTIQDVLYKADGTRFEGIATISWQSFQAVDSTTIAAKTFTTSIVNGFIHVRLTPTTNAITPASYTVVYNGDGNVQFSESWIVPSSNVPIRIRDVRIGAPGTVLGAVVPPSPVTSIQISDIIGLPAALNIRPSIGTGFTPSRAAVINPSGAIDAALGNMSDCIHVDGSSGTCGSSSSNSQGTFVDGEIPSGAMDGVNRNFTVSLAPNPPVSLELFRNGILQRQGGEYALNGSTILFASGMAPSSADVLVASYRVSVNISGVRFIDAEVPSGPVNGVNTVFVLSNAPVPAASLEVYRNGLRLRMNLDYTVSGTTLTFQPGLAPQSGDVLQTCYRST